LLAIVAQARLSQRVWRLVEASRSNRRCWPWTRGVERLRRAGLNAQVTIPKAVCLALGIRIPRGARIEHTCGNTNCANPAHFRFGLTPGQVRRIRRARLRGVTTRALAAQHRCSESTISYAARRVRWRRIR
jgi:hypothetical protein